MSQVRVVSVGDTPTAVIAELAARAGGVRIVRRCAELTELLAACQSGIAQAAVIATPSQQLTATLIDRLTAVGVCVIAISASPADTGRLQGMGATPLPEDASAEVLTQSILAALEARKHSPATGFAFPDPAPFHRHDDAAVPFPTHPAAAPEAAQGAAREMGRSSANERHASGTEAAPPVPGQPSASAGRSKALLRSGTEEDTVIDEGAGPGVPETTRDKVRGWWPGSKRAGKKHGADSPHPSRSSSAPHVLIAVWVP